LVNARINGDFECALMDVHSEGFAVIMPLPLPVGAVVRVDLLYRDETFGGKARVRNCSELESGRYRIGLDTFQCELDLRSALREIAIAVQRQRLRRLSERRAAPKST
jgi:hypothetical protein